MDEEAAEMRSVGGIGPFLGDCGDNDEVRWDEMGSAWVGCGRIRSREIAHGIAWGKQVSVGLC